MTKPKTLLSLKKMYHDWPASLSYPMMISGIDFLLKSAWHNKYSDVNYKISFDTIHREMKELVSNSELPNIYRFGHNQLANVKPKSSREEVLAIGLYNTLLYGCNSTYIDGLGNLSIIDYQVPVTRGKSKDIGCMDLLGLIAHKDSEMLRPVILELKGQIDDTDNSRRDCSHYALLEAWIYFLLFYRKIQTYSEQLVDDFLKDLDKDQIDWKNPVIAILGPQEYWEYWNRSDDNRGLNGLMQFHECCAYMSHIYTNLSKELTTLDVIALSLMDLQEKSSNDSYREQIRITFDSIEKVNPEMSSEKIEEKLRSPATIQWSDDISENNKAISKRKFREQERDAQINFKKNSQYVEQPARNKGFYQGKPVDYCFPERYADENLYHGIREQALKFFKAKNIAWHSLGRRHLLSSQSYCVNFLFPFANRPQALQKLFGHFFCDINKMLPIEDNLYVTFEWNSGKNYLNEYGYKKRGELATYPDAAIKYQDISNNVHIILIEWKYTESYQTENKADGDSGTRRVNTYRTFIQHPDSPLDLSFFGQDIDQQMKALFYEPFYQLMREQLLAKEIKKDPNNDADKVSVLHVCPKENDELRERITSPELKEAFPNKDVVDIWKQLLKERDKFLSTSPADLFQKFDASHFDEELQDWATYMSERYRLDIKN